MVDLERVKSWYEERPKSLGPTYENIGWLIAEVERLKAERDDFMESYRLAMVSVNHAYDKGRDTGRLEALNAVFQINGPSRAIAQLKEKYAAEVRP